MSADGSIELDWGDGAQRFRLRIGELLALEDRFDLGVAALLDRFADRTWRLGHVREILRLALIGAGAAMEDANRKVARYVDEMAIPPAEHMQVAYLVLAAAMTGPLGDDLGKPKAGTTETGAAASSPPRSTDRGPGWDGRPTPSTAAASGSSPPRSRAGTKARKTRTDSPRP